MSVAYNGLHVDEKFAPVLEPNLYHKSVFADGITFTAKYENGPAGGIYVRQATSSTPTVSLPGADFTDVAAADTLIAIAMVNNYQSSKKIYGVAAAAVEAPIADQFLSVAVQECADAWNKSGIACLLDEGTSSTITAPTTYAELVAAVLGERAKIVKAGGSADVVMMSADMFAIMLQGAGSAFTPETNEAVNATGQIGKWLGMTVVECGDINNTSLKYYNYASTLKTKSGAKVQFIVYNHEALSICTNFDVARIIDSENFAGSKAQCEINAGFRVTSGAQVRVASVA